MELAEQVDYDGTYLYYRWIAPPDFIVARKRFETANIIPHDGRSISPKQNAKAHAILGEIGNWSGYKPDEIKPIMKYRFILAKGYDEFSMSDVDMTTATEFIEYLIDFCLMNNVPTMFPLFDENVDVYKWVYMCAIHKRCAVNKESCKGKSVHLHHWKRIGITGKRKEMIHLNHMVQSLCYRCHDEAHLGQKSFDEKYKLVAVKADLEICKKYKLKYK